MANITPLAIATGDTHLRKNTWSKHPTLSGDAYRAFNEIVDICIREKLPLLLLGDIMDSQRPDSETVAVFCAAMDAMKRAGLSVYFVQGNHDFAMPPWPCVHPWPEPVHRKYFNLGPFSCYGIDYTPRDKLQAELDQVPPPTQILCMHQAWSDMLTIGATDGEFAQIKHGRYLLTGDYHKHGMYRKPGCSIEYALSPGSTTMQALNEDQQKYVFKLGVDTSGQLAYESVPLYSNRGFAELAVRTPEELASVVRFMEAHRTLDDGPTSLRPIVRIKIADDVPGAYEQIAAVANGVHLFPELQSTAAEDVVVQIGETPQNVDFETLESGLIAMHTQGKISDESYSIAINLLRSATFNPQAIYEDLCARLRLQTQQKVCT